MVEPTKGYCGWYGVAVCVIAGCATDGNIHGQGAGGGLRTGEGKSCPGFAVPPVTSAASASVAATGDDWQGTTHI
ncbi:hypothetical protein U9R62_07810 [Cylindrospermopsis raciborskii DSH]|uniref:hypothetical protein n=1 Tax=Cylindrospermopsis raciborskii TaxID=77022 RepID=UPI002EDB3798